MGNRMSRLVTSDQFITGVLCELALQGQRRIYLADTDADNRFEEAFSALAECAADMDVELDFSLRRNPYHGDSETLRDTLYQVRDRGVVAINNPSFKTVEFQLNESDARSYFARLPVPQAFFTDVVARFFPGEAPRIDCEAA